MNNSTKKAKDIFMLNGGTMATADAIGAGIHPETLYRMERDGILEKISRGLYRLADQPDPSHPDFFVISRKMPNGVICLISALAFHEITTQIPHRMDVAIKRGMRPGKIDYPPVRYYYFSNSSFISGVEEHIIDGNQTRIYSPEKTLADCFKFRNKIGIDTAIEALKLYIERKNASVEKILKYAKICRVKNIMLPYLEVVL